MARKLKEVGFKKVYCLEGGYREWDAADFPTQEKWSIELECINCHMSVTPHIVSDWKLSAHSKNEVTCSVCHGAHHMSEEDVDKIVPVQPEKCIGCHEIQGQQFKTGKHALAWAAMKAMPTAHWQPMALMEGMKGCGGCHKLGLKTEAEIKDLMQAGTGFGLA